MSKFVIRKRVELSELGEDWKECYLEFNAPSYGEIKVFAAQPTQDDQTKAVEAGIGLLEKLFIGGKGFDGKEVIDITKTDLQELPVEVITKSFQALIGTPSPNL